MSRTLHFLSLHFLKLMVVASFVTVFAYPSISFSQQQNIQPLLDRLERLERDIRTLNVQIARGGTPTPLASGTGAASQAADGPAIARMGARMDSLEADLRGTTGAMEQVNFLVNQISERLDKLVSDVDFRLSTLETQGGVAPMAGQSANQPSLVSAPSPVAVQTVDPSPGSQTLGTVSLSEIAKMEQAKSASLNPTAPQTAPASVNSAPAGILPAGTAKEQYNYAFNLLRQTNYDQAEVALKQFITTHAGDPLASNARYWLGETYYARKAYTEAAQAFFEGYSKDSKGSKAPDSLLKLGMSLAGMGKGDEACAAFGKVLSDYPKAASTVNNAVARERKRNSCP